MPKNARWICLEPMCARFVSSRATHEWCTCGKWLLPNSIELPVQRVHLGCVGIGKGHFNPTCEAMIETASRIDAERATWRRTLGIDQGFDIPDPPIPATRAEIEAEITILTELENAAYRARLSLPPGREYEVQGVALVEYRSQRWRLLAALRGR